MACSCFIAALWALSGGTSVWQRTQARAWAAVATGFGAVTIGGMPLRRSQNPLALRTACAIVQVIGLCAALTACVVLPVTSEVYDPQCQVIARHVELQAVQIAAFQGCSNQGCAMLLAAAGATAAVSAVVSGSIAVVGNAVYWVERQGRCISAP